MNVIQDRMNPLNVIHSIHGRIPVRTTEPEHFRMTEGILNPVNKGRCFDPGHPYILL